eukprot:TRINITY_DN22765_c0_g1_i1.p1 TRINITY_DN22765_c0_g1~~TRINITY_DN22765_c0_g1_i1.p1  ORF type:complete len:474 (+),score=142.26 TRINITY_DN22765_c0_g1_i1:150-1571(+)
MCIRDRSYTELCGQVMSHYISEEDVPKAKLSELIAKSYDSANWSSDTGEVVPLVALDKHENICLLEQFHGPTCAFKDVALQFLGNLFEFFREPGTTITVLGATSGDTGGAAICGLRGKNGVQVCILHPEGKVAELQKLQMTSVIDKNVHNLAVDGDFDDCQNIVKTLFVDQELQSRTRLGAVNSINWARILAQIVYYFSAYFQWCKLKSKTPMQDTVDFVVPSGNFGNALAGFYAKQMGLPIGRLVIATNHNDILHRLIAEGDFSKNKSVPSRAPAMDITVPSNFERYLFMLGGCDPAVLKSWMTSVNAGDGLPLSDEQLSEMRSFLSSGRASDEEIDGTISALEQDIGMTVCTHTAVGLHVATKSLLPNQQLICFATAHHGKFGQSVEESLSKQPPMPPQLACLEEMTWRCVHIQNDKEQVKAYLKEVVIEPLQQKEESKAKDQACEAGCLVGAAALGAAVAAISMFCLLRK